MTTKSVFRNILCSSLLAFAFMSTNFHANGQQAPSISMTTARGAGEKVVLKLICDGPLSITGVKEEAKPYESTYTLTNQTIVATGNITRAECFDIDLQEIDVTKDPHLQMLFCQNNQLSSIDITHNPKLTYFYCDRNAITHIDFSGNPLLNEVYCNSNNITQIDLTKNPLLEYFYCGYNQIEQLNLDNNGKLVGLYCENNNLSSLDVSKCKGLLYLLCFGNRLNEKAMDRLIASLPPREKDNVGSIVVVNSKAEKEGNVCSKNAVKIANQKNWNVLDYNGDPENMVPYEGSETATDKAMLKRNVVTAFYDTTTAILNLSGLIPLEEVVVIYLNGEVLAKSVANALGQAEVLCNITPGNSVFIVQQKQRTTKVII